MHTQALSRLLAGVEVIDRHGVPDTAVSGLSYDSRRVRPGYLFVAVPGFSTDGNLYVEDAVKNGATAVLHTRALSQYDRAVAYLRVSDARRELSRVSAAFFDHPSERLSVIGVTGTDGKSTTVWFIHQLLEALEIPSGFISTVHIKTATEVRKNPHRQSTPEACDVQAALREMVDAGKTAAVLEATSHGLSARTSRLSDVRFKAGVMTNLSHEHLDFHGTFAQYRSDKANLFRAIVDGFGVVNRDDPNRHYFTDAAHCPVHTYSTEESDADVSASQIRASWDGTDFELRSAELSEPVRLNVPGEFNVRNLLAAVLCVSKLLEVDVVRLVPFISRLTEPTGRMLTVDRGQPFRVIVDFAHTPAAFESVMSLLRPQIRGRMLAVFGSAGERDTGKRPMQGAVAAKYCDEVVLTDEDPRGEDRWQILREIASGIEGLTMGETLFMIPDRSEAIRHAIGRARDGDLVLLLGKGHEEGIIRSDGASMWNETKEALKALQEIGFPG